MEQALQPMSGIRWFMKQKPSNFSSTKSFSRPGDLNMLSKTLCASLFLVAPLTADPWGKDADIAQKKRDCIENPTQKGPGVTFSTFSSASIKRSSRQQTAPRSHFIPSSSQYTLEAVRKYGFFKGWMLGCDRLMRENDEEWVYRKTVNSQDRS